MHGAAADHHPTTRSSLLVARRGAPAAAAVGGSHTHHSLEQQRPPEMAQPPAATPTACGGKGGGGGQGCIQGSRGGGGAGVHTVVCWPAAEHALVRVTMHDATSHEGRLHITTASSSCLLAPAWYGHITAAVQSKPQCRRVQHLHLQDPRSKIQKGPPCPTLTHLPWPKSSCSPCRTCGRRTM
jgi:hypothetical protein